MITLIKRIQILLTNVRIHFVIMSLISIFFFIQNSKLKQRINLMDNDLSKKNRVIDSLKSEILVKDIDIGRYDYILELIKQENPQVLEKVIHETE
jgi:hypothetical protein